MKETKSNEKKDMKIAAAVFATIFGIIFMILTRLGGVDKKLAIVGVVLAISGVAYWAFVYPKGGQRERVFKWLGRIYLLNMFVFSIYFVVARCFTDPACGCVAPECGWKNLLDALIVSTAFFIVGGAIEEYLPRPAKEEQ